jgi:hypothetical protein
MSDFFNDDLRKIWLGTVVDVNDPEFKGRVKVKIFGKFDNIINEHIPWAYPIYTSNGGSSSGTGIFSTPKLNSIVSVRFNNDNIYYPEYYQSIHICDELKEELKTDYVNAHSLLYDVDEKLKITYFQKQGLLIQYNDSIININPDKTIKVQSDKDGLLFHIKKDHISLGKLNKSAEPCVLGDKNVDALNAITKEIKNLIKIINEYCTTQNSAVVASGFMGSLSAGLLKLQTSATLISQKITKIENSEIPKTKSTKISLE